MGLGSFLKSFVNPEVCGDEIIKTQIRIYYGYKQKYPDKDKHSWLANTYLSRRATEGLDVTDPALQLVSFTETMVFSCLPEPDCIRALGLYIVYKERPDIIQLYPKFEQEFMVLMLDIENIRTNKPKKYLEIYKRENPITSKNEE